MVSSSPPSIITPTDTQLHPTHNSPFSLLPPSSGKFCAGFDINQFVKASGGGGIDNRINDTFVSILEDGPKPTVAAISGVALGGGLEVALACNARVSTPQTNLGLPELQLGIIPGFGGTQRLPRVVGLAQAIKMMLTSAPVKAPAAAAMGLVDILVSSQDKLIPESKKLALEMAAGRVPRQRSLFRTDKIEPLGEALQIIDFARAQAAKQARGLLHPQYCLDAIQAGVENGGLAGLHAEGVAFAKSAALDTHKALVHIFFAQRTTKKIKGVTDQPGLRPRPINTVAVLGGGLMGSGIATACILVDVKVILKEVNEKFLEGGMSRIKSNLASRVKKGKMTEQAAAQAMSLVVGTLDYSNFKSADMVIEAVIEDVKLKQTIFADLERACRPDAILSSNTSTIDIELIGDKTPPGTQSRIVGAHFFSPAHIMPLLEIVKTNKTSPQVILDTLEFGSRIKKTPVIVGNCTGFAVNRVFFPYTQAACMLVDRGLDPYMIDKVIAGFGMPMGPFRLSDLVGADIGLHVGSNFLQSFPERCYQAKIIPALFEAKRLGEKTGSGFYKYDGRRKASPDPAGLSSFMAQARSTSPFNFTGATGTPPRMSPQDIVEFIFFPVVNEGCRVIEEGIVDKPADLDVATVMAMGFPPPRGGLIFWADLVGAKRVCERLSQWAEEMRPYGLSGFFEPCEYLKKVAAVEGGKLESGVTGGARM